jgi:HK97 family phage portal protein
MKIFGLEISKKKAASNLQSVGSGGWFPIVRESYDGAWQQGVEVRQQDMLAHSAVFACVSLIASDIAKLPIQITEKADGIWKGVVSEHDSLLRKPNGYQNRVQFIEQWIGSKLLHGNAYALKRRDSLGRIVGLLLINPERVEPLIAEDGSVFYRLSPNDRLSGITDEGVTVPAREIIHDRMNCFFHPLIGISPLTACALAANQGMSIQKNSVNFFGNNSNPGGVLTAPGAISKETADRLKAHWENNYSGKNAGRVAVLGDGLKYEQMAVTPSDAQLIDQLKWTAESVCTAFHVPAYKIGAGVVPTYGNAEVLNQIYYTDCLQSLIEALELSLDDGLDLPLNQRTELDLDLLLRMDTVTRFQAYSAAIGGGWMAPNEARRKEGMAPVEGGDTCYMQQQDFSLAALAKRDQGEGVPQ